MQVTLLFMAVLHLLFMQIIKLATGGEQSCKNGMCSGNMLTKNLTETISTQTNVEENWFIVILNNESMSLAFP